MEETMKTLVSMFALALALAFTAPAFAGDVSTAKNQSDCLKAGGNWDAQNNICKARNM
jgi:hypothetical protein